MGITQVQSSTTSVLNPELNNKENKTVTGKRTHLSDSIYHKDTIVYDTIYIPAAKPEIIYVNKEAQERIERVNKESNEIVTEMYNAIDGWGTDNELFEKALKEINADNIYEVNELWNRTVGNEYGETFIESFLNDASFSQRKTYAKQLFKAMEDRSKLEGLETSPERDELSQEFDKELSKIFVSDEKLSELFTRMNKLLEKHKLSKRIYPSIEEYSQSNGEI